MIKSVFDILEKVKARTMEARAVPYELEVIAESLNAPWAIALSDEGTMYVTERSGAIRIITDGRLQPEPLFQFSEPFVSQGEGGLMGIALDPNFLENRYLYVMHSYLEDNQIYNRVVRLVEKNSRASIDRVLLDKIPGGRIHNGGRLKIGPDRKLYITTGDAGNPELAQDPTSTAGKILRIELDGSIPIDNPIANSPVYSLGHRNPQGVAWSSRNVMYAAEHGATAHDEINIIHPGANYGWPLVQGDETSTQAVIEKPLLHSDEETWAPSGIAFVNQGPWKGRLLVATLRGERLLVLTLNASGTEVNKLEAQFTGEFGRLREVVQDKDGSIYLLTNNTDGRGRVHSGDDKMIRFIPRQQPNTISQSLQWPFSQRL
jgi:glucose/arabinose dehydrogenase